MAEGKKDTALGLGERLRSARKARALTLEQAAFTLRLEASVVRALEDERFEALGAAVFVRGHLKAYAKLLGLSEEVVLAAYRAADPGADAPPRLTRELEKPLTTTPGPLAVAVAVGFAVVALLLLYALGGGEDAAEPAGESSPGADGIPMVEMEPLLDPASVPAPVAAPEALPGAGSTAPVMEASAPAEAMPVVPGPGEAAPTPPVADPE